MDFFTAEVLTLKGLLSYYVLFFIHLETRRVSLVGFTPYPDQAWLEQQARNVTMEQWGCLRGCRYLLHDRDRKFSESFRELIESGSVKPIRLPARSPNLNSYVERWVRSVKDECLSRLSCLEDRRCGEHCSNISYVTTSGRWAHNQYVILRMPGIPLWQGVSFAKTPAGFKISSVPQRRVTCYLDGFQTAYVIIADHRDILRHSLHPVLNKLGLEQGGFNIFRRFRITELETAEVPAALQHTWSGHAKSHTSEVYKKLLKQRAWRLRWAEKAGTGFALPGHQQAAAETPNGKSGKILEFRKVG